MAFDWTTLEPVRLRMDTSGLRGVATAMALWPKELAPAMREVLIEFGGRLHDEIRVNLSGRVLNVRTGRLLSSWRGGLVGDWTWVGHSRIGYGALWESGFTASPGIFPVRASDGQAKLPEGTPHKLGKGQWVWVSASGKSYPMEWRRTRGGPRAARPWAQPAMEAIEPEFVMATNRAAFEVMTFQR